MSGDFFAQLTGKPGRSGRGKSGLGSTLRVLAIAAALAPIAYSGGGSAQTVSSDSAKLVKASWASRAMQARNGQTAEPAAQAAGAGICGTAIALSSDACKKDAGKNLTIGGSGCGPNVYVDKSFVGADKFDTITISSGSTLCFPDTTVKMDVGSILVNGLLQVGQKSHPIGTDRQTDVVTLDFFGKRPCAAGTTCSGFSKGIQVLSGGSLQMYGLKGVPPNGLNWTYLSQPAGPPKNYGVGTGTTAPVGVDGETTLRVADDVTQGKGRWQRNDWITVGSTSFAPYDTEIVRIAEIKSKPADNPAGSDIILDTPLVHYHFGSEAPTPSQLCTTSTGAAYYACGSAPAGCTSACISQPSPLNYSDPAAQNYGVDERAPVALLSRNIKLASITDGKDAADIHWGGETRTLMGFKEFSVQGVELQKFGKDQLASYPIHFHMAGDASTSTVLVDSNSIDHSYNKCITVHSTQNLTISNTVCVRAVGHLFYEEIGDESGVTFNNNLGLGAMSNSFNINKTDKLSRDELIKRYWWSGDYMTNGDPAGMNIDYDGFNIPDTDSTTNPTRGSCTSFLRNGALGGYVPPTANGTCPADNPVYIEPASGFWITNPGTILTNNIIDGCQGVGIGYWYVPPGTQPPESKYPQVTNNQRLPVGRFTNNRAGACFDGLFGEGAYSESASAQLHPMVGGTAAGRNLLAEFDGLTATRIRDRGVWMRDQWFVVNNGRFATSRDDASLLTAGGIDGATPGDWMLLENSVLEGISQNNVDRFGPCPEPDTAYSGQQVLGGCVDRTPVSGNDTPSGGDEVGKGYPDPNWNMYGYMIYDGPARLIHDRFANFLVKPALTTADTTALTHWGAARKLKDKDGNNVNWVYEGDAAFGWFQSNQSSYPTLANTSQLSFVNTDLRHQIYTELVNLGKDPSNPTSGFGDGDQNTAVIDLDGTLAGFVAVDSAGNVGTNFNGPLPISLNGLTMNASSNSVDECLAEGAQDAALENRPTALMSPSSMATLELQMLYPPNGNSSSPPPHLQKQAITFAKDAVDFGNHGAMTLTSRNALGVWEPKVTSGLSYTVTAAVDTNDKGNAAGINNILELGIVDAFKPNVSPANPFYVRLGICYRTSDGQPFSASSFTIARGYHSYGGGTIGAGPDDPELRVFYNKLNNLYIDPNKNNQDCDNLVGNNLVPIGVPINLQCPSNPVPAGCPYKYSPDGGKTNFNYSGCPADGITLASQGCPTGTTTATDNRGQQVCVYPTGTLSAASSLSEITNPNGTYNSTPDVNGLTGLDKFYYDSSGWLFLYVAQQDENSVGPSPLANCKDSATPDPSCPKNGGGETYYVCPPEGCADYVVTVTDPNYKPGVSTCSYPTTLLAPEPPPLYHLALSSSTGTSVDRHPVPGAFPHYAASSDTAPVCK
ncbi:MAG TPA: G8 domain-containing protein [Candidatus Binataceae bacterium]|nr:G8 domain-containing protein [Candidatus Binataceae bacterium]